MGGLRSLSRLLCCARDAGMIYDFWLFNRFGDLLFYEQWHRTIQVGSEVKEEKLMYGLLYMLKQFSQKISPKPCDGFNSFKTADYRLHLFESGSGLKFVMRTDPNVAHAKDDLLVIYSKLYVDLVAKNPFMKVHEPIKSETFRRTLSEHIKALRYFDERKR